MQWTWNNKPAELISLIDVLTSMLKIELIADLDDGVTANYNKFKDVLVSHKRFRIKYN